MNQDGSCQNFELVFPGSGYINPKSRLMWYKICVISKNEGNLSGEIKNTSVSARWRVPYTVEENLRGMNERQNERKNDTHSGFLILDFQN